MIKSAITKAYYNNQALLDGMNKLILAITLMLSMNANAKELTPMQREAPLFTTFLLVTALTTNPIAATLATAGLYVGMDADLKPGKRYKRHTRSGR
jgi:hypothetical protein